MDAYSAVRAMSKDSSITLYAISKALGKSANYINNGASRGSIPRCDTMARMADVCGYKLALVPADELTKGALVIGPSDDKEAR